MRRLKEPLLNGLLALLVLASLGLSSIVWFPTDQWRLTARPAGTRVNTGPTNAGGSMPDILRPERIYIRRNNAGEALLPAGSDAYFWAWIDARSILESARMSGMQPVTGNDQGDGVAITLVLPLGLELGQWAEYWRWPTYGLPNQHATIDRVTLFAGSSSFIELSGPSSGDIRVGPLDEGERKELLNAVGKTDDALFLKYRELHLPKDSTVRVASGLLVPEITSMESAQMEVRLPDMNMEEARYFPDLSVVRQIDEQDAKSYTDGQRLLKFYRTGVLEYWSVPEPGSSPDLERAKHATEDWVDTHGGWSQDLVLSRFQHQVGTSTLTFEIRRKGPYPVESANQAARVEVAGGEKNDPSMDRITRFRRFPEIKSISFGPPSLPIITPEQAMQIIANKLPNLLFDVVREIHPAYMMEYGTTGWGLAPVWVVQAGATPIYVPATLDNAQAPTVGAH